MPEKKPLMPSAAMRPLLSAPIAKFTLLSGLASMSSRPSWMVALSILLPAASGKERLMASRTSSSVCTEGSKFWTPGVAASKSSMPEETCSPVVLS